jgi:hypothetical protein
VTDHASEITRKFFQGTRYKLTYDGMWHLDIPKTRQYDHGKVEVIARNSAGEAVAVTELVVKPRQDDYRNVLKNSPRRKSTHCQLRDMILNGKFLLQGSWK